MACRDPMSDREVWTGPPEVLGVAFGRLMLSGFVRIDRADVPLVPYERALLVGHRGPLPEAALTALVSDGGRLVVDGTGADVGALVGSGFLHRDMTAGSEEGLRRLARMFSATSVPDALVPPLMRADPAALASWLALVGWGVEPSDAWLLAAPTPLPEGPWGLWGLLRSCADVPGELAGFCARVSGDRLSDLLLWLAANGEEDAEVLAACWRLGRLDAASAALLLAVSTFRARG